MYKYSLSEIKEEVNEFVEGFHLYDNGFFTEEVVDFFISEINEEKKFDYSTGATKCVIIPEDKDYVIKIPFNGRTICCEDCEYNRENDFYCSCCEDKSCPITPFYGGGGKYSDNYCERERELYDKIIGKYPEFKDFFLPLELIEKIDDYPIYIQVKAEIFNYSKTISSEKSKTIVSSDDAKFCNAPIPWLGSVLENLNNDLTLYNRFIEMLEEFKITGDLHSSNVGYYDNHAIILDYAGFYDN